MKKRNEEHVFLAALVRFSAMGTGSTDQSEKLYLYGRIYVLSSRKAGKLPFYSICTTSTCYHLITYCRGLEYCELDKSKLLSFLPKRKQFLLNKLKKFLTLHLKEKPFFYFKRCTDCAELLFKYIAVNIINM